VRPTATPNPIINGKWSWLGWIFVVLLPVAGLLFGLTQLDQSGSAQSPLIDKLAQACGIDSSLLTYQGQHVNSGDPYLTVGDTIVAYGLLEIRARLTSI
jgi:hypothetical protein